MIETIVIGWLLFVTGFVFGCWWAAGRGPSDCK